MAAPISFGKVQFEVSLGNAAARSPREPESPFRLLVLGDFSGRTNRGLSDPVSGRRPVEIDCDNADGVLGELKAELKLPPATPSGPALALRFETLDDFHPDQLVKQVGSLAALLQARRRIQSPATAAEGVAEARGLLASSVPATTGSDPMPATSTPATSSSVESDQDTFARLLGGASPARPSAPTPASSTPPKSSGVDVSALIKNLVAPSSVPQATPEQTAIASAVDAELTGQLRAILHHPDFQAMEATWRGLDRLVREFGGEENLKISLLDVSKAELAADVKAQENLAQTGVFKALREQGWALILGSCVFNGSVDDLELLGRLGKIAASLGAPFVAAANPHWVGCESLTRQPDADQWTRPLAAEVRDGWAALRGLPEAAHLGLVLPRVLIRQPYGRGSDVIDAFPFEELSVEPAHDDYLWASGAFVCGYVIAEAFRANGWELTVAGAGELDDLPVHKFTKDGETQIKPGAEVWLSERTGDRISGQGFMPLLSIKGRGAVRLASLQSIALPSQPLAVRTA